MSDEDRIEEIRQLFSIEGYDLIGPHKVEGREHWSAPYQRKKFQTGAAAYGDGPTPLDAAENAWAKYQAEGQQGLTSRSLRHSRQHHRQHLAK
jgi:hypothetical protein